MKNKPFLKIGETTVSLEKLYCLVFDPDCKPEDVTDEMLETSGITAQTVKLCQTVRDGTIEATCECSSDEYPCVELQLQPQGLTDDPIVLVRAEQQSKDGETPNVYLYGRGDSYIAKMPVDPRPDNDLEEIVQTDLLVSGDPDCVVKVKLENQYVSL